MKNLITALILFCTLKCNAQETMLPVKLLSNSDAPPERLVGTDAFGWLYTIAENEFHKSKDVRTLKYKDVQLGEIYKADIQNPLQIVLFYKTQNTAVLLDNQLNETARINFSRLPENQPGLIAEAVGLSGQNKLWVYDINSQQIGRYDLAKGNFMNLTPPFNEGLAYYTSDYNYFYWLDTNNICRKVNIFGHVTTLGTIPEFDDIQIISAEKFIYSKNNFLYVASFTDKATHQINVAEKSFTGYYYGAQILTIFTATGMSTYQINLP